MTSSAAQKSLFAQPEPKPAAPPQSRFAPDVLRVFEHKVGPFRELLEGGRISGREFRIVELRDHTWFSEFTDTGERRPMPIGYTTEWYVGDAQRFGVWREITE